MKKIKTSLSLTSIILSSGLLTLSPVLAKEQINHNYETSLKKNLKHNFKTRLKRALKKSNNTVDNLQNIEFVDQKSTVNSNEYRQTQTKFFTNKPIIPATSVFQLSSQNKLPITTSTGQPQVKKTPRSPTVISQTPGNFRDPKFGEIIDNTPPYFGEVINVDQLQDVSPEHWAYQALRSLVEKYRCISDSSSGAFNGNRVLNRYEFAAALNFCLVKVERSIYALGNRIAEQKEDLALMQRLQAEFATELETITARVDSLEQRVALVDSRQFSTTTVLRGSVNFNLISAFGNRKAVGRGENPTEDLDENLTLSGRMSLSFDTSFTGKDRLRTRIQAGNVSNYGAGFTGTDMTRLIGATNTGNDVRLGSLFYEFPLGDKGIMAVAPAADFPTRIFPALNPVSSISNFGAESPIYSFAFGAGTVAYYQFTDELAAGISYLTFPGNNPDEGLFKGQYTALTQLTYTPSNKVGIALTYGRYYAPEPVDTINVTGSKGSNFAQLPFGDSTATSSNALGLQFTYKLSDKLIIGGWGSYFNATAESSPSVNGFSGSEGSDADIWSWAITASLKDFAKLGSQVNFVFGMPPKVTSNDVFEREDEDTSLHFELSYRYPLTDRIFITPGFLVITNPEHNANNDTIWIGLMRTSFSF
ncbi:MAG: iron uptake porin [Rivularia sp. (in: cyanobacteria)]